MGIVTMNMSGYEIEREDVAAPRYGDDVLYADWTPALSMQQVHAGHVAPPAKPAIMDVDVFLRKMYAHRR